MPRLPSPYQLRDWTQVTRDYLNLVLDPRRAGEFLPALRLAQGGSAGFTLPSYLGLDGAEAINVIAAAVSGGLAGIDVARFKGQNWLQLCEEFFSPEDGVYFNNTGAAGSGSFWYDIFPNILAFQLHALFPKADPRGARISGVAERWRAACVAMGGGPNALPDFDHTGFRFASMTPVDNHTWIEPDAAAGIGWLQYMAWTRTHDARFLTAADWCVRALELRPASKNPLYEVLLPYGALVAARMNAELGRDYDVGRLLNWCFEPGDRASARWGWGVIADRFGADDCYGLVGSVIDTDGYAFAMNTFQWAGALVPLARYDVRYAPSIGRWMLNLVNAARLFYPGSLPASHQDDKAWSARYDAGDSLGYEGLRKQALRFTTADSEVIGAAGRIRSGSLADTRRWDDRYETLVETTFDGHPGLEHTWRFSLPAGASYNLLVRARTAAGSERDTAFRVSYARSLAGPYTDAFTVDSQETKVYYTDIRAGEGWFYVRAESAGQRSGPAELQVDFMRVESVLPALSPYATGDAQGAGNPSNLCLYGSSHVGVLGGIVEPSSVKQILRLDLLKTDWFHMPAYPTYLYYSPHDRPMAVRVPVGDAPRDLYDACSRRVLARGVRGDASIEILPDSSVVLVVAPAGGKMTSRRGRRLIDGVVVDYGDA